ncbi:SGNH hydrolase-type esterase domain-containing protein [Ephemerocybe angulata]|uniref:SGNH hydrolase-type esterase domain-containing protein n=1 Tax=Ephemerocybe angulata TaxID=980116 RepID=A0A8H6IFW6_9AGAR|nr:SGNH hydrolase-type esterase domain-containing protein [Tulosesus angulatus]
MASESQSSSVSSSRERNTPMNDTRPPPVSARTEDPALLLGHTPPGSEPLTFDKYKRWVILGDSYCSTTSKNWIGKLLERNPGPKNSRPVVHNFAQGGDTVEDDLDSQLARLFKVLSPTEKSEGKAMSKVLFVIWMGINDCGRMSTDVDDFPDIVEKIFDAMHKLYVKHSARAFLLIDVPPMHRSPGGLELGMDEERYEQWNEELLSHAKTEYSGDKTEASVAVVSSYTIISDILDNPDKHGLEDSIEEFKEEDSDEERDSDDEEEEDEEEDDKLKPMWEDDIHLSEAGHAVFAEQLWKILGRP